MMTDGSDPLVSIVVPVLNGEPYLGESLKSILAQTYPRREVLVLDNASTDRTPHIVRSFGEQVLYHHQPFTKGLYANVNDGIARARGEYVAVYHADDVYLPTLVEREVRFLQHHPSVGAVFCRDIFIDQAGRERARLDLPLGISGNCPLDYRVVLNALLRHKNRFLRTPSSMVPAAVYRDVGQYREAMFQDAADIEMWLRIAQKYPLAILDDYLYLYRFGHNSASSRYRRLRTEPDRFFQILDLQLADGGRAVAEPESLSAYEAHRAEDFLMVAVSRYIVGDLPASRAVLARVGVRQILGGRTVQRARLVGLMFLLRMLTSVPRIPFLAAAFFRRWHGWARIERLGVAGSGISGPTGVVRLLRRIGGLLRYWLFQRPSWYVLGLLLIYGKRPAAFAFRGRTYAYFYHFYGLTYLHERAVEVPIVLDRVRAHAGGRILEIGNVLSHYTACHHDVVDKYERAPRVMNLDVVDFHSGQRYDFIVSISTLEHVGWDETSREPAKPRRALEHLVDLLAPGGELFVTFPLGYNPALDQMFWLRSLPFTEVFCLRRVSRKNEWREVPVHEAAAARYGRPFRGGNAVVVGIVRKGMDGHVLRPHGS